MQERFKEFTFLIAKLNKYIHKIKTGEMAEFNLKGPHVTSIYYLYKCGALTAKEIRNLSGEDKASISRAIDYLEERGYVTCESCAEKRYNAKLILTDTGKEIGKRITDKIDRVLEASSIGINPEHRAIMYKTLALVSYNLEEFCAKYDD